jgi:hypothetical protein
MTSSQRDTTELAEKALDAFWTVVCHHFPQAQTGDLSAWATIKLQQAAEAAIDEWIDNNAQPCGEGAAR